MSFLPCSPDNRSLCTRLTGSILLFVLILSQSSCTIYREDMEGSADFSKVKEGGPSANVESEIVGWNLSWGILSSLPQNTSFHNDHVDFIDNYKKPDMNDRFALSSKLGFVQKGSKPDGYKIRMNVIQLTEDIVYDHTMQNKSSVFAGLGPYFSYGIGGKTGSSSFSEPTFGGQDGLKRFDAGLNLMAGYRLPSGFYARLGYDFGIVNQSPAPDFTSRNRCFSINFGYSIDKIWSAVKKK